VDDDPSLRLIALTGGDSDEDSSQRIIAYFGMVQKGGEAPLQIERENE
jgi:hypothetical protein